VKILWHSVAPWVGTGYGNQTGLFAPRVASLGHDVAISAYYGLAGTKMRWRGLTVYPHYAESYGTDVVVPHALDHFGATAGKHLNMREAAGRGVIITLGDVWTFRAPLLAEMNVAAWVPIDHETVPPIVSDWLSQIGAIPIAMSRFGQRKLQELGLPALYVPHGVDTSIFHPGDKAEARERAGLPADAFIVAMVAANIGKDGSRKAFAEQIIAFKQLYRRHPDSVLALHTDVTSKYGVNVLQLLSDLPETAYAISGQYDYRLGMSPERLADIYRSADLFTNTSWGEGFGVPIIEAQACGTPVVVTDTTAMPELCGAGWVVQGEPFWHDSQKAWARRPLIGSIVDAYLAGYDKAREIEVRARAWEFAQDYDADRVLTEYFKPALAQIEQAAARRASDTVTAPPSVVEADGLLWLEQSGAEFGEHLGPSEHEAALAPLMEALLPEGGTFLDVGAHVGHWALRLAGRAGDVVAVEANPRTASVLRRNVALNDLGHKVAVVESAAWDEDTVLQLHHPDGQGEIGGSTRVLAHGGSGQDVSARPLDELLHLNRLDLVKLDVEGADLHALRGMAGLLRLHEPTLLIECHDYCGYYSRDELHATLDVLGYTYEVAHRYWSDWTGQGPTDTPVPADYLVAVPAGAKLPAAAVAAIACSMHRASQREDELAQALELVASLDPKVIVEIGCDLGGTLFAWRWTGADVYGITLPEQDNTYQQGGQDGPLATHGATVHEGDSHDKKARAWLRSELRGRPVDVLVLDGDHSTEGLQTDLAMYRPLVRDGGLILVHDIASYGDPRAEVWKVWPGVAGDMPTTEIRSRTGRPFGWGVIHVQRPGE